MGLLGAVEAANFMVGHTIEFVRDGGDGLHEAYHGFVAFRVELFVVSCLKLVKLS